MLKTIDPQFKQSGSSQLSDEVFSMIFAIKQEIEKKKADSKEIS